MACRPSLWWGGFAALLSFIVALAGSRESFWLDELHTSWAISGEWADIVPRARAGNQTPLYCWLLYVVTETLGRSELASRLPSAAATALATGLCVAAVSRSSAGGRSTWLACLAVVGWVVLDRIQLFYASEARVYALIQLTSLGGWLCIGKFSRQRFQSGEVVRNSDWRWLTGWAVLASLSIHLHLVCLLPVAWQALWGIAMCAISASNSNRSNSRWVLRWFATLGCLGLSILPALGTASVVWDRRAQWQSFAGEASGRALVSLFPLIPVLVPVAIAICIGWIATRFALRKRHEDSTTVSDWSWDSRCMWLIAAAGPWLSVWLVTALGIAPMMHRRYVICSAMPLAVLAATELLRIRFVGLKVATLIGSVFWLLHSQGTLDVWKQHQWVGWQRGEDWHSAAQWIDRQVQAGDGIWCASGLIEAQSVTLPLAPAENEYLSFPLRGRYQVQSESVEPRALIGDAADWTEQLLSTSGDGTTAQFVVYRGRVEQLSNRLRRVQAIARREGREFKLEAEPRPFGYITVAKVVVE